MQERQDPLDGRRPGIVVPEIVHGLDPGENAALGVADDRLLGFGDTRRSFSP